VKPMAEQKRGVLLHVSSLPSPGGIGTLGAEAREFIDLLHRTGQGIWQILPLGPVGPSFSPYSSESAYAGNPLFIDPRDLAERGLLRRHEASSPAADGEMDHPSLSRRREQQLAAAYAVFAGAGPDPAFETFLGENDHWLADYSLYRALKNHFQGLPWTGWPTDAAGREPGAMAYYRRLLRREVEYHAFVQYLFYQQWQALKKRAEEKQVEIIGDLPIYMAGDSCDVWAHREIFLLDGSGHPAQLAGVPPDYFSQDGQLWGNPVYNWPLLAGSDYAWWRRRIRHSLKYCHTLRLDHFRGFQAFWAVPAGAENARAGQWLPGPGAALFRADRQDRLPFIAEDLGFITPEVVRLKADLDLPGMQVFQFAAEAGTAALFRALGEEKTLFCTGTHDNDTLLGWYRRCLAEKPAVIRDLEKAFAIDPRSGSPQEAVRRILGVVSCCGAERLVLPAQDLLSLDSWARMNVPGTAAGNWRWRLTELDSLAPALQDISSGAGS